MKFNNINLDDKRLGSYQIKLSQDILEKRISLKLSRSEDARLTGLIKKEYTKIEQGIDLESSKEKYQNVLAKLIDHSNSNNLFAKHPEIDLKSKTKALNMEDNGNLVGKENVWKTR